MSRKEIIDELKWKKNPAYKWTIIIKDDPFQQRAIIALPRELYSFQQQNQYMGLGGEDATTCDWGSDD